MLYLSTRHKWIKVFQYTLTLLLFVETKIRYIVPDEIHEYEAP